MLMLTDILVAILKYVRLARMDSGGVSCGGVKERDCGRQASSRLSFTGDREYAGRPVTEAGNAINGRSSSEVGILQSDWLLQRPHGIGHDRRSGAARRAEAGHA